MTPQELSRHLMTQYPGLVLTLSPGAENYVILRAICLPRHGQGHGIGTAVMETIVEEADARGWRLALTPSTVWGASSRSRLERFYGRFGFLPNKGRSKDFTTTEAMVRPVNESVLV